MRAWYYGPAGESRIFADGNEIPPGWADNPAKVAPVPPPPDLKPGPPEAKVAREASPPDGNRKARKQARKKRVPRAA
jgi:hypothetical protein